MVRLGCLLSIFLVGCSPLCAATLERLSLEQMVAQSSAIVRAKAVGSHSVRDGALIFTVVELEVLDQWKGKPAARREVSLPGGQVGGFSQHFGGVPVLESGQEFVAFLWTGPSGRTQLLGLSQGFFDITRDSRGQILVHRKATADLMLNPGSSMPVPYPAIEMPLDALVEKIRSVSTVGGSPTP
jgi:hypothetical protein